MYKKHANWCDCCSKVIHNINHHYGEMAIRAKFQDYVQRFVRLAAIYEAEVVGSTTIGMAQAIDSKYASLGTGLAFPDETSKQREMAANINRIKGWRKSISYKDYQQVNNNVAAPFALNF